MVDYPHWMKVLPMIVMHKMGKCQLSLVAPHPQLPSQHPYIPLHIPNPTIVKDVQFVLLQHHPPCINKVTPTQGATRDNLGGMGEYDWAKHLCFANNKLSI